MLTSTLHQFTEIMRDTIIPRRNLVKNYLINYKVDDDSLQQLKRTFEAIEQIPNQNGWKLLRLNADKTIRVDVNYELEELKKDIWFFENGEEAFIEHLGNSETSFNKQFQEGLDFLNKIDFNAFITDRDGTVNNYCGRYSTSIQSAYNAIFLSRYAVKKTKNTVLLTSAPLNNNGLIDLSVMPSGVVNYAGSKGREYYDTKGVFGYYPIKTEKQEKLNELNRRIKRMFENNDYEVFARIGSGLQEKFGQTTIARQDINKSIDRECSDELLQEIKTLVHDLDPEERYFRIEDTGLDIEIILTIDNEGTKGLKDFDKGDGLRLLNEKLDLDLQNAPNLICGDTNSDVAILLEAMKHSGDIYCIFVTREEQLKNKVKDICPQCFFVDKPDVLVSMLNQIALR